MEESTNGVPLILVSDYFLVDNKESRAIFIVINEKTEDEQVSVKVFSTRVDEELQKKFRSIALRKGSTICATVSQLMQEFIFKEVSPISGGNNVPSDIGGSRISELLDNPV